MDKELHLKALIHEDYGNIKPTPQFFESLKAIAPAVKEVILDKGGV